MARPRRFTPGRLRLAALRSWLRDPGPVRLAGGWREATEAAARTVASAARARPVYGVNTGFGKLSTTRIAADRIEELQLRLVRSHASGTGPPLPDAVVRLTLLLKAASLARGLSGVRPAIVDALLRLLAADVLPLLPSRGSVGASGDLAPLAHLALLLIGEGEARVGGRRLDGTAALDAAGLEPLRLGPKEGLALLNGTQVSTALALVGLFAIEDAFAAALVAGAMSVDGAAGSDEPFDARIQEARGQPGQAKVAAVLAALLSRSAIRESHREGDPRVQDPYSLRCQPQVMGACLDLLTFAAAILEREANGVTDNPLVFAAERAVLSGGNFHAEPVAFAADILALAAAEIGALSERRIALLVDADLSGLPPFLAAEPGLDSGFMLPQVTAAALAAELQHLAHPVSTSNIPTSAGQEDHVSMSAHAAWRLLGVGDILARLVAIELLAAARAIELRHPLVTSPALARGLALIRDRVPPYERDRPHAPDIETIAALVQDGVFRAHLPQPLLPSDERRRRR